MSNPQAKATSFLYSDVSQKSTWGLTQHTCLSFTEFTCIHSSDNLLSIHTGQALMKCWEYENS